MDSKEETRVRIWIEPEVRKLLEDAKVLIKTPRGVRAESFNTVIVRKHYQMEKLKEKLEAVKDILKLPDCKSSEDTPDMILGFEEQFYLKEVLEGRT